MIDSYGLQGTLTIPGDKSISHRSLMFSSLVKGQSRVQGLLPSADVLSTRSCLRQLGVDISELDPQTGEVLVSSPGLLGWQEPTTVLDCGNSGTTIRLMSGLLAGQAFYSVLFGDNSLHKRPMARVIDPLHQMGAQLYARSDGKTPSKANQRPPVTIVPTQKPLVGLTYTLPVASAQVKSALLLAGLLAQGPTHITEPLPTRDHTERMLNGMGASLTQQNGLWTLPEDTLTQLNPVNWLVPGDPSSAAFMAVAALLIPNSCVCLQNVGLNPTRTGLFEALKTVGANITVENPRTVGGEAVGDLIVKTSSLKGDLTLSEADIPALVDEIPILTIAGLYLEGTLTITGADELRKKESDRLLAMQTELAKVGVEMQLMEDGLILKGNPAAVFSPPTTPLQSWHDHRIAMSLSVLNYVAVARQANPQVPQGPNLWPFTEAADELEAVINVSYPGFFGQLNGLLK